MNPIEPVPKWPSIAHLNAAALSLGLNMNNLGVSKQLRENARTIYEYIE